VPIAVVSLDARMDAAHHLAVGRALYGLRAEGVVVFASGSITHNLGDVRSRRIDAPVEPYAQAFADWVTATVCAGDAEALVGWQDAPQAARAHPTPEHFVPLLVAAGAGGTRGAGTLLHASYTFGVLGMHAYAFG
jgi:4,5-DOPA dioxygenase extradiol